MGVGVWFVSLLLKVLPTQRAEKWGQPTTWKTKKEMCEERRMKHTLKKRKNPVKGWRGKKGKGARERMERKERGEETDREMGEREGNSGR